MFRTEVKVTSAETNLTLLDGAVTIGSCFAEVIGSKLQENKVPVLVNPFGTIFNPVSVASLLLAVTGKENNLEQNMVQRETVWYNYSLHSSISSPDRQHLQELIAQRIAATSEKLKTAKLLIVTLGTAIGYELEETGAVVANCHKLPAKLFKKQLLSPDSITQALTGAFEELKRFNPNLEIVLTVSPVRHVKETLQLNSVSKSVLRLVCHTLTEKFQHVHYFPAYEIMLDDLRDYRFYGADMLHPTSVAEDYIWDKFLTAFYHASFQEFIEKWSKIKRAVAHRPFHPAEPAHQFFIENTLRQLERLAIEYHIPVDSERKELEQQLVRP